MRKTGVLWILLWVGCFSGSFQVLAAEYFGQDLEVHGFISQGFLKSDFNNFYADTKEGTFQFNEFGLNVSADLTDRLHAGMQFLSRDLGDFGNNRVEIDWAYADYRWKDWMGFRAGLIKMPWGIYNETRDIDMLRTSIFLPPALYAEEERDSYAAMPGIDFYGNLGMKFLGNFSYQFQYGDKTMDPHGGLSKYVSATWNNGIIERFEVKNIVYNKLEWEPPLLDGLRLRETSGKYDYEIDALGGYDDPEDLETPIPYGTKTYKGKQMVLILSAEYVWNDLTLAAEWLKVWEKDEYSREGEGQQEGWYVSASHRLTDRFELGAYYSVYYSDAKDKEGKEFEEMEIPAYLAWQKNIALTTRFDINDYWTIKLEGHFVNGAARIFPFNLPELPKKDSFLFAFKTTFNF